MSGILANNRFGRKGHRKAWIEEQLQRMAAIFETDLLGFSILSNRFHLILASRSVAVQA